MGISNGKTKAMIMAAGVGSRLDPLTKNVPKPLVPILNMPVMDILMQRLSDVGIKDVVANTFYLAEQIQKRYAQNRFGIRFDSIRENELSGTAGGFKKCQYFFDKKDTIVVLSGDGLSDVDLKKAIDVHRSGNTIATIGVKEVSQNDVSKFGVVVTDGQGFVVEFQEKPSIEEAKSSCINTGIYIFDYKIFDYIPKNTFFDFARDVFPALLAERQLNTFKIDGYWSDIGSIAQYKQSVIDIMSGKCLLKSDNSAILSDVSNVDLVGYVSIGENCVFGKNVQIENCILWDNIKVADNVILKNSVIADGCIVERDILDEIVGPNEKLICEESTLLT